MDISAPDGKEIDFNDQVREFIRHACEDHTNVAVAAFQLPSWVFRRSFGDKIGRSNSGYAETFILEAAANLTSGLRSALSRAHRKAVIETAQAPAPLAANARTGTDRKATTRPPDRMVTNRRAIIGLIPKGVKGEAYCKALDGKLSTPIAWQQNEKCPKRYLDAYWHSDAAERKKWRNRIWNERYKAHENTQLAHTRNGRVSSNMQKHA